MVVGVQGRSDDMSKHQGPAAAAISPDTSNDPSSQISLWLKTVMMSCFFLAALFQSCQSFIKYNSRPINSVFSTEHLAIYPSVTICPVLWMNYTHAEWMLKTRYGLSGNKLRRVTDRLYDDGTSLMNFYAKLGRLGINVREFAEETAVLVYDDGSRQVDSGLSGGSLAGVLGLDVWCFLSSSSNALGMCNPPIKSSLERTMFRSKGPDRAAHSKFPMFGHDDNANWTTYVSFTGSSSVRYCSTMDPNVFEPFGDNRMNEISLEFHVSHRAFYRLDENSSRRSQDVLDLHPPSFEVTLHPREQRLPRYAELFDKIMEWQTVSKCKRVKVKAQAESFSFLDVPSDRCDPEYDQAYSQHGWDECLEQNFLPCSYSPYTAAGDEEDAISPATSSSREIKSRVCNTSEEFAEFFSSLGDLHYQVFGPNSTEWRRAIMERCLQPCSQLRFALDLAYESDYAGIMDDTEASWIAALPRNKTAAGFLRATSDSAITISPRSRSVRVIKQEPAYPASQFLGEMGGTWGLFLGFSLVTFLELADQLVSLVSRWVLRKCTYYY